ncbi:MAG TPA: hypothetical protein VIP11_07285, partial [Gemmatimonadaceae bacterium]
MDERIDGHTKSRGTILVASPSGAFADIIGGMIEYNGFTPAYPAGAESASLSITRTQPCVVICDCDVPADSIRRLIFEASTRRVPLLLAGPLLADAPEWRGARARTFGHRVEWLALPVSREDFGATLDSLAPPARVRRGELKLTVGSATLDSGGSVRTLVDSSRVPRVGAT